MKALFGRKIENIVELREATECSRKSGIKGTVYTVTERLKWQTKHSGSLERLSKDQP